MPWRGVGKRYAGVSGVVDWDLQVAEARRESDRRKNRGGVRVKVRVRGGDVAYLRSGAKAGGWWRGCWKTQHSEEEAAVNLKKLGGTILFEEREGEEGRMSGG
jgi:hypothetical protein